jgi:phage repressor protein C with HTH and peptisase S24 domain
MHITICDIYPGMSNLGKRIKHFRELKRWSQSDLARACGWESQSRIGNYEAGSREPPLDVLRLIAGKLGVSLMELLEEGPSQAQVLDFPATYAVDEEKEMAVIRRFAIAGGMGQGQLAEQFPDVIDTMRVSKEWLSRNVIYSSLDNLALITGLGDSMEGTFSDGDVLLVDRGVTEVKLDAVYVLSLHDELYIKRLQRRPDGSLLMISDNDKYPPYVIENGDRDAFKVEGRVLLAWNARKL